MERVVEKVRNDLHIKLNDALEENDEREVE